ncbi:hypothetical protein F0U61_50180 [Archangium violaceum]|uniref:hypothetical protein n=1 Tax=Archangium violaceum TaxID=83451 RepID=UPI002B2C3636|nr:hypothetical protein F0U61_50180 [Archangium violaceum]
MEKIDFEEWNVAPDSHFPAWHFVEEFMQRALGAGVVEKIVIFERASLSRYELVRVEDCLGEQEPALGAIVRNALRRDALLGFVIRDSRELAGLLKSYRKSHRGMLGMQDVMRELGAEVSGLENVLSAGGQLVLVGHDGEPLFTLSIASRIA